MPRVACFQIVLLAGLLACARADILPSPDVDKALLAARKGDYSTAAHYYREALKSQPKSIELWNGLGVALNRQERYADAAEAFRSALRVNPAVEGIQLNLGIALFRAGKLADAVAVLEKVSNQDQGRQLLAMAYVGLEKFDQAAPMLEQLARSSTDPAIHIALASSYARLGRKADVDQAVARMFQVVPDGAPLHTALAQAYETEDDADRAIAEYRKAAELDPSLPGVHLQAGRLLWKARRFEEAEPELLAELERNPGAIDAKYYLGSAYLYGGDAKRAVPLLEDFVRVRKSEKNAFFELGRALLKQGETARAISALEKAVALGPNEANLRFQLAQAYRAAGRMEDAQREFDMSRKVRTEQLDDFNQQLKGDRNKN